MYETKNTVYSNALRGWIAPAISNRNRFNQPLIKTALCDPKNPFVSNTGLFACNKTDKFDLLEGLEERVYTFNESFTVYWTWVGNHESHVFSISEASDIKAVKDILKPGWDDKLEDRVEKLEYNVLIRRLENLEQVVKRLGDKLYE